MNPLHSESQKISILAKLLPPYNLSVSQLAAQEGISMKTVYNWRKKAQGRGIFMPKSPEWSAEQKLAVVIETSSMSAHELSQYCRQKGLYPDQIKQWKQALIEGLEPKEVKSSSWDKKRIKALEKELKRKDKALAETAALLVLQKKLQTLWEDEDE